MNTSRGVPPTCRGCPCLPPRRISHGYQVLTEKGQAALGSHCCTTLRSGFAWLPSIACQFLEVAIPCVGCPTDPNNSLQSCPLLGLCKPGCGSGNCTELVGVVVGWPTQGIFTPASSGWPCYPSPDSLTELFVVAAGSVIPVRLSLPSQQGLTGFPTFV